MKNTLTLLLVCMISGLVHSQSIQWDSTHRPGSFTLKVNQFKSYSNSKKDLIFLGNSITAGTNWMELLATARVRNRGISGDITFGVLERLDEITEGKPEKVFILIGINDISRNIPDHVIINNYEKIIKKIKSNSPRTKIYFQTLMPTNNTFTRFKNHYNKDAHIAAVNAGIKKLANQENVTLIDLHPHFLDAEGRLEKAYTHDGLHLNAEGYQVWAKILKEYVK